ncbi:SH3 domain-containing protein [Streptomyces sp. NPDC048142]|uniref:SH3 domain-containing protein n=1 Tax=Streptomyces sp. NPDC048142 TaxID=3365501 RepID=UPI00371DF868
MRTLMRRTAVTVGAGAIAFAGILGTSGAASAAESTQQTEVVPAADQVQAKALYARKVWKTVNHRTGPSGSYGVIGKLYANRYYTVSCWKFGQTVTAEGTTNSVWIYAKNGNGRWGYSSAIYFSGNKYGNLPYSAKC